MTTQRRIHGDVQAVIEGKALERWTPTQIEKWLNDDDRFKGRVPTLRTIQRIVKDLSTLDMSGEWRLLDSEPADVKCVIDTLGAAILATDGRVTSFTRHLADLVIRISRAAPDLGLPAVYLLASRYALSLQRGEPTSGIDALLGFAPWRGPREQERFEHALVAGWIPGSIDLLWRTARLEELNAEVMSISESDPRIVDEEDERNG